MKMTKTIGKKPVNAFRDYWVLIWADCNVSKVVHISEQYSFDEAVKIAQTFVTERGGVIRALNRFCSYLL